MVKLQDCHEVWYWGCLQKIKQLCWIGAYLESSTTILLIIGGMMYYITYILTVTTCFGFQH